MIQEAAAHQEIAAGGPKPQRAHPSCHASAWWASPERNFKPPPPPPPICPDDGERAASLTSLREGAPTRMYRVGALVSVASASPRGACERELNSQPSCCGTRGYPAAATSLFNSQRSKQPVPVVRTGSPGASLAGRWVEGRLLLCTRAGCSCARRRTVLLPARCGAVRATGADPERTRV